MPQIIESLSQIASQYDAAFVDLWGCVHNGVTAYPAAIAALQAYRAQGGKVVLVTNAPRHRASVAQQIARMGVPDDAWDIIATSGDSARFAMFTGAVGEKVWFMGEAHDEHFFDPLSIVTDPVPVRKVSLQEADGIVCCGPFDPHADPEVNRKDFLYAKTKGMKLLCANPDIVVDRGERREWCAGALAKLYTDMGGESLYFGKPHPPIYDLARRRLAEIGGASDDRILCIGDGIGTDIAGAMGEELDSLFITGGLAAEETSTGRTPDSQPDPAQLTRFVADHQVSPSYAIGFLR